MSNLAGAHAAAVDLLNTIQDYSKLCRELQGGMPPDDRRVDEITIMRARVRTGLQRAESDLLPQLGEFACVNEWPISVNGFRGSSAHQATMKFAAWLLDQPWRTDTFREFFRRYYDVEKQTMNWEAVREARDKTNETVYDFCDWREWDQHEALLEMEYAKASKLAGNPRAEVPKLTKVETDVLEALGDAVLIGRDIAAKSGYDYSYLRDRLPRLVEKGVIEKVHPQGYRRASQFA